MADKPEPTVKPPPSIVVHSHCPLPSNVAPARADERCELCKTRLLSICGALDLSEVAEIEHLSRPLCYAPKDALMREGEANETVFNVTAGMVRLSRTLPDGQRQIVGFAMPGDFLGLDLGDQVHFSAEAINTVSACRFARNAFVDFVNSKTKVLKRLQELTATQLSDAQNHMVILGRKNAEGKLAAFLIHLRDRLARVDHVVVNVPLAMTRQDIADYLGLTIETVSRTLSKFAKQRLIVITPDGVRLLNEEKLRIMGEL